MISIICPTRNRPANITRFISNLRSKATNEKNLQFVFYVDEDDSISTPAIMKFQELNLHITYGKRVFASEMFNTLYKDCNHDIIFNAGDDMVIHNQGWDQRIINIFNSSKDKILMVYGPDGYQPRTFGTHFFIHKNWIKVQGNYIPVNLSSDYVDTWYNDIADQLKRKIILDDFGLEHLHPLAGKAEYDSTYTDRIRLKSKYRPDLKFDEAKALKELTISNLQKFINESNL